MRFLLCLLLGLATSPFIHANEWTTVTNQDVIKQLTDLLESALDGREFSETDDDTRIHPTGLRYGTRHHMNSCTVNPKLSNAKVQKRGGFPKTEYRIEMPCLITSAYIRYEYRGPIREKKDDALRQECDLEVVIAPSGSSVKVLRQGDGSGNDDGRNRMMKYAPRHLTKWINDELKN